MHNFKDQSAKVLTCVSILVTIITAELSRASWSSGSEDDVRTAQPIESTFRLEELSYIRMESKAQTMLERSKHYNEADDLLRDGISSGLKWVELKQRKLNSIHTQQSYRPEDIESLQDTLGRIEESFRKSAETVINLTLNKTSSLLRSTVKKAGLLAQQARSEFIRVVQKSSEHTLDSPRSRN